MSSGVVDTSAAVLFALNARTGEEIYHSGGKDVLEATYRFITPAAAGGRVYIGAGQTVAAFGIAKH